MVPTRGDRASTRAAGAIALGGAARPRACSSSRRHLVGLFLIVQAVPLAAQQRGELPHLDRGVLREPRFGIAALFWATVITSVIAMLRGPARGRGALFITEYAPRGSAGRRDHRPPAAVPSIVFGFWGLSVAGQYFQPVQDFLAGTFGFILFFKDSGFSAKSTLVFAGIILAS